MMIAHCPRCNESVRLPAKELPGETIATCPWCGDEFSMAEVQELLPPMLIVPTAIGPTVIETDDQLASEFDEETPTDLAVDQPEAGDAEFHDGVDGLELVDERSETDTFGTEQRFDFENSGTAESPATDAHVSELQTRTPTKRRRSVASHWMVQAVLGFLVAIPIAAVVLALFGSPLNLGFWPFDGSSRKQRAPGYSASVPAPPSDRWNQSPSDTEFDVENPSGPAGLDQTSPTEYLAKKISGAEVDHETSQANIDVALNSLQALEGRERDRSNQYWREVVTVYSQVAALVDKDDVDPQTLQPVLDRLQSSRRLVDLAAKTAHWLQPGQDRRDAEPLLNNGVILSGRLTGGETPTVTLGDGTKVLVSGDVATDRSAQPILALGRLVDDSKIDDEVPAASKRVHIVIRRVK